MTKKALELLLKTAEAVAQSRSTTLPKACDLYQLVDETREESGLPDLRADVVKALQEEAAHLAETSRGDVDVWLGMALLRIAGRLSGPPTTKGEEETQ